MEARPRRRATFRQVVFWIHLVAGVVGGLVIAMMSLTGAALAFEHELVDWAERDLRRVAPPAAQAGEAPRLSLAEMSGRVRAAAPGARIDSITLENDPAAAVVFTAGRGAAFYVDPYTGEVRPQGSARLRAFLRTMTDWHRWLGREGDARAAGRAATGACNLAFLVLAVSGLYLWWPRRWTWRVVRPALWFSRGVRGRARDWNWHNVLGLWSAPVLIVLTATGAVISYRWASDLVFVLAGSRPPAAPVRAENPAARSAGPATRGPRPDAPPAAAPQGAAADVFFAAVVAQAGDWEEMTLRLEGPGPGGPAAGAPGGAGGRPRPVSVAVREPDRWPRFSSTSFLVDPSTGEVLRVERFAEQERGRRARSWMRFLHTGQALGWPGQLVAGLASLAGAVLVYTGLALAWRRFFPRRMKPACVAGEAARARAGGTALQR